MKTKNDWGEKNTREIKRRLIQGCENKISPENVNSFGAKYLEFFKTIFPDDQATEIKHKINYNKVEAFVLSKVDESERLGPTQIKEIIEFSNSLNILELNSEEKVRREYDYYITNWEIDNGLFKGITSDFILNKNELCIYKLDNCELSETKLITKRINYSGPSFRLKLSKNFSYRLGSYDFSTHKEEVEVSKGSGILNVTTKRMLFKSAERVTTIKASTIVDLEPYKNAIIIMKETGNPLTIRTSKAPDLYQYLRTMTRK